MIKIRRKRKKTKYKGKTIIIVTSIALLSFLGISYGQWNEGLRIQTSVSTGDIDPVFCDNYRIKHVRGNGDLNVRFDDEYNMNIYGEVEPGYKAFLHYGLINEGSIPVKLAKFTEQNQKVDDEIKIQLNQQSGVLDSQKRLYSKNRNQKLQIQVDSDVKEGLYTFEIKMPFKQWTCDDFE